MKTLKEVLIFALFCSLRLSRAQDDPQDIADIACASSSSRYEFNSVDGYIESPNYPSDYADYEYCQWYLNPTGGIPDDQRLYLEIEYFYTESCCDEVYVREGEGIWGTLLFEIAGSYSAGTFFSLGNEPVTLQFTSDYSVNYGGFRVYFYVGEVSPGQQIADMACGDDTRPVILYNDTNILETPNYPADHPDYTECEWIITPNDNGVNGIYLNVLYFYTYNYLYIYFADSSDGSYETYWYGSYSPGYSIYNPGNEMTLSYSGYYNYPGFQLLYFQLDPACTSGSATVIDVGDKAELKSPGYPYDVPEHLSCRWLLEVPEGQKVMLTSLDLNLYGDGIDCTDEYVEVLDGDTVDALSLGKFCGDVGFGTIPSTGTSLQVYLRSHTTSIGETHSGFRFEYESA